MTVTDSVVRFHLELEDGTDADDVAMQLEDRLRGLEPVREAEAAPDEQRSIAELTTIVVAAAVLARGSGSLVVELRRFVQQLSGLVEDLRGLKRVIFDVDGREIALDELGDDELAALAETA